MKNILLFLLVLTISFSGNSQIFNKQIPDKLLVFTFDDATESQYSVVAPLLKEYGFGATFFVCEIPPNFNDKSKYMTWKQIQEIGDLGFEVGNHTRNHPAVDRLSEAGFKEELNYIENKCDSLGLVKPTSFVYPGYNTPPKLFKEYLQYLSDNHFKVIALRDLDKYIKVKKAMKNLIPDLGKNYKN